MLHRRLIPFTTLCALLLISVVPVLAQDGGTLPAQHRLDTSRIEHLYQTWNNCSGATITMGLSYYGMAAAQPADQFPARDYLKPDNEDQNVSPWQIVDYVNDVVGPRLGDVRAVARRGGDIDLLRTLLANDFPVIIEKGFDPPDEDWMGHYLLMIGYDDTQQIFYTYDSFLGHGNNQGRQENYAHIEQMWGHFNDAFIVLYPENREAQLQQLMGDWWAEDVAWRYAWNDAAERASVNPNDYWAWFNLGEAATALGEYETATQAYRVAFDSQQMPWRVLWYMHGAFEAFYQAGQFDTVLELATNLQAITPYIEEANYYRGLTYAAQGDTEQALFRLQLVLDFNPNFYPAREAMQAIQEGTFVGPQPAGTG